jgi:hypothetical protein
VVANPTNPFDSPEPIVIGKFFNRINGFPHSQIITTGPFRAQITCYGSRSICADWPIFAFNLRTDIRDDPVEHGLPAETDKTALPAHFAFPSSSTSCKSGDGITQMALLQVLFHQHW